MATTPERIECVALSEVRATCRSTLVSRHPRDRVHAPGTGPKHDLACVDQVVVTLVVLRFQLPHQALAELYDTRRSAAAYVGGLFAHAMTTTAAAADPSGGSWWNTPSPSRGSGGRCKAGSAVRNPCDPEPRLHRLTRMSKLVRRSEEAMFRRALAPRAERLVVVAFAPPPRRHRRDRANRSADSGVRYGESGDRHGVGRETARATMPEQATVVRVLRESDHVELLVGEGGNVVAPAVDQRPEPLECHGGGGSDRPAFSAPAGVHRRSTPIPPRSGSADAPAATRWSRPAACRATSAYSLAGMSASPKSSTHPPGLNALGVATSPRCRIDLTALRRKLTAHLSRRHRVPRRASPVRRDGRLML